MPSNNARKRLPPAIGQRLGAEVGAGKRQPTTIFCVARHAVHFLAHLILKTRQFSASPVDTPVWDFIGDGAVAGMPIDLLAALMVAAIGHVFLNSYALWLASVCGRWFSPIGAQCRDFSWRPHPFVQPISGINTYEPQSR